MSEATTHKACKTCNLELPLERFTKTKNSCKQCCNNRKRLEYQRSKAVRANSPPEEPQGAPSSPSPDETSDVEERLDLLTRENAELRESVRLLREDSSRDELLKLKMSMADLRNDSNEMASSLDTAMSSVHELLSRVQALHQERLDRLEAIVNLFIGST